MQIGGRGKLGGIKVANDKDEAREHASTILGMDIRGLTVHEVWIEEASQIEAEYYASIVFDRAAKAPLVMLSTKGGMDIEAVAEEDPDAIATLHVDPLLGFQDFHGRRLAFDAGIPADLVRPTGAMLAKLYATFVAEDAMLLEVNPLIVTPERKLRALDAKVTLDDNALFRHPESAALRNPSAEDPQEQMAKERGLTYVKLDGDIGILGNGAGLVMSTLDVVAQVGGAPANFLDAGGGSKADAIVSAVEVILSDSKVKAVLFNIFGGITRCDEVAKGLIEAFERRQADGAVRRASRRHERRGGPAAAGRGRPRRPARRGDDARRGQPRRGAAKSGAKVEAYGMSILIDKDTRLCVSGITGREGTFHATNNKRYGTNVVSGVTPGKGGQDVDGIPVFNTFHEAVEETGANAAMVFVPPRFAADSVLEAADAGIATIICITEGIPAHDELRVYTNLKRTPGVRLIGPNCPGVLSPGKANVGIIPAAFFKEGNVGVVSRSGTLTYQIGNELAQRGFGNSSIVGIGGDPVPGSSFIDIIALFEDDPETELIVMSGEIGGVGRGGGRRVHRRARHQAGRRLHRGLHRAARQDDGPRGRDRLRHAGTAQAKADALEAKGVRVGRTPTEVSDIAVEILGG